MTTGKAIGLTWLTFFTSAGTLVCCALPVLLVSSATVTTLESENAVTLEQIRLVIRQNGFTPKDAALVVSGRLTRADEQLVLANGSMQQFSLIASADAQSAWQQLQALPHGAIVEIEGRVEDSGSTRLSVLALRPEH